MLVRSSGGRVFALAAVLSVLFPVSAMAAADVITVGTLTATGSNADVPVYIRDVTGTPLGVDRPAGSKIQSFSIKVNYSPASAVQSVSFSRAGITASLSPTSEFKPASSGSVSLLATFQESDNAIPFRSNPAAPGDLVAHLVFALAPSATPGSTIALTLDTSLTQLTDSGGTAATKETVGNGALSLVNGQITVPALTVSLSPATKRIAPNEDAQLTAVLSGITQTDAAVTLTSSNPAVATVPASIVIPAGSLSIAFKVTGLAIGTARITATMGSSSGNANVTVATEPEPCARPIAPLLSAPGSAGVGAPYTVSWGAVTSATDYVLEESEDDSFTTPLSQTLVGTSASFNHETAGARYYYRVRARNRAAGCDLSSLTSSTVSVLISETPVPAMRVLAVVGSLRGNAGSFFRTSLQLYNPRDTAVSGRIVFHRGGSAGSAADPSLAWSILPGRTLSFADLLPAMGLSGIGSADIVADATSALPVALARVFNDAGAAGTNGLGQDALAPERALGTGRTGVLLAPDDAQRFRLNVGVRSLEAGAVMSIIVRDRDGAVVKTAARTYAPTFFEQVSSANMLDGYVLAGGETISFEMISGSAFVYGATTDNTTNDPSVQMAAEIE